MRKVLDVQIGQVKIAKNGEILKALLGSCVGIGIIWEEKKICGLAHCLLPKSPAMTFNIGGRFVDQALKSLIAMMKIRPDDFPEIQVVIVGGGNMTSPGVLDDSNLVGSNNYKFALEEADRRGLPVVFNEGGGEVARKIFVDATNFSYRIEKIPRTAA